MDNETNTATAPNAEAEARSRLLYFVKRIEDLEMDKSGITKDIRDVFIEAKCAGYDTKAMREVIKQRKLDPEERESINMMVEHYDRILHSYLDQS